mgnify:CR=1 FL=1
MTTLPGHSPDGLGLVAGDTLLVETDHSFVNRHRYNRDFLLQTQDFGGPRGTFSYNGSGTSSF